MAKKVSITRKDKYIDRDNFFLLLDEFINHSYSGKRTKKNGSRITRGTIVNYECYRSLMVDFTADTGFDLKLFLTERLSQRKKEQISNYYKRFYKALTNYMYDKKKYYDNYVGTIIKHHRCFLNHLAEYKALSIGSYHKLFYVPHEEIQIVTLNHHHVNYLLYNEAFNENLRERQMEVIRDIFVFGCTVALRFSDLMSLTQKNLLVVDGNHYIQVRSLKTGTNTSVKLPDYCVNILKKYNRKQGTLLPHFSNSHFNYRIKDLGELLPENPTMPKTRLRRGKQVVVYKDAKRRKQYRLSDHLTTHTMRRTAITVMLSLGMPEYLVRKVSGHKPNSKEFFRYVQLAQETLDKETDKVFEKIVAAGH